MLKEIDIFVTPTGYDYRKYRVVDLSQPVYYDSLAIIMPYPREGLNADAIYMTFDWPVNRLIQIIMNMINEILFSRHGFVYLSH